jgi:hypothetical protein
MLEHIPWLLLLAFLCVLIALLAATAVVGLALPSMILRASCSVADVKEPPLTQAFPLGYAVMVYYVLWAVEGARILGRYDVDPDAAFGSMHLCGFVLGVAAAWLQVSLAYRIRSILAPSLLKGFWVASLQLLLSGLVAGLFTGVLLTTLSVWQMLGFGLPWSNAPAKPAAARAAPAADVADRT